jgi:hypothetical protein
VNLLQLHDRRPHPTEVVSVPHDASRSSSPEDDYDVITLIYLTKCISFSKTI